LRILTEKPIRENGSDNPGTVDGGTITPGTSTALPRVVGPRLAGGTWAERNPGKPVIPSRVRPRVELTHAERVTAALRMQQSNEKKQKMHEEIEDFHELQENRVKEIAEKYHKKPEYIRILLNSGSFFKSSRAPNIRNAIVHHVSKEINEGECVTSSTNNYIDQVY
jgi:hypothetical protein